MKALLVLALVVGSTLLGIVIAACILSHEKKSSTDYNIYKWVREYNIRELHVESDPTGKALYQAITFIYQDDPSNKSWTPFEFEDNASILIDLYRGLDLSYEQYAAIGPDGSRIKPSQFNYTMQDSDASS